MIATLDEPEQKVDVGVAARACTGSLGVLAIQGQGLARGGGVEAAMVDADFVVHCQRTLAAGAVLHHPDRLRVGAGVEFQPLQVVDGGQGGEGVLKRCHGEVVSIFTVILKDVRRGEQRWLAALLMVLAWLPAQAVTVNDDEGRVVRLQEPARRIVSLAPHATELLFAVGAGGRIVGAVEYSDYPAAAKAIPRVGRYDRLDLERILALRPDLVVSWASGNPCEVQDRLRRLGLAVFASEPREPEDVASNLERLGRLTGNEARARQVAEGFRQALARLARRYGGRAPVSVFYQIWDRPLMTLNGEHLVSKLIELCGGRNVFAELPALAPQVSLEAVLAADPRVIVISGKGAQDEEWLSSWRRWPALRAVREGNLFVLDPDIIQRHTPRLVQGTERLCGYLEQAREGRKKTAP